MTIHHVHSHQGIVVAQTPEVLVEAPQEVAVAEATQEEIAVRAYDIYLTSGRVQGQCKKNWEEAQQSLHDHCCCQTQARGAEAAMPQA